MAKIKKEENTTENEKLQQDLKNLQQHIDNTLLQKDKTDKLIQKVEKELEKNKSSEQNFSKLEENLNTLRKTSTDLQETLNQALEIQKKQNTLQNIQKQLDSNIQQNTQNNILSTPTNPGRNTATIDNKNNISTKQGMSSQEYLAQKIAEPIYSEKESNLESELQTILAESKKQSVAQKAELSISETSLVKPQQVQLARAEAPMISTNIQPSQQTLANDSTLIREVEIPQAVSQGVSSTQVLEQQSAATLANRKIEPETRVRQMAAEFEARNSLANKQVERISTTEQIARQQELDALRSQQGTTKSADAQRVSAVPPQTEGQNTSINQSSNTLPQASIPTETQAITPKVAPKMMSEDMARFTEPSVAGVEPMRKEEAVITSSKVLQQEEKRVPPAISSESEVLKYASVQQNMQDQQENSTSSVQPQQSVEKKPAYAQGTKQALSQAIPQQQANVNQPQQEKASKPFTLPKLTARGALIIGAAITAAAIVAGPAGFAVIAVGIAAMAAYKATELGFNIRKRIIEAKANQNMNQQSQANDKTPKQGLSKALEKLNVKDRIANQQIEAEDLRREAIKKQDLAQGMLKVYNDDNSQKYRKEGADKLEELMSDKDFDKRMKSHSHNISELKEMNKLLQDRIDMFQKLNLNESDPKVKLHMQDREIARGDMSALLSTPSQTPIQKQAEQLQVPPADKQQNAAKQESQTSVRDVQPKEHKAVEEGRQRSASDPGVSSNNRQGQALKPEQNASQIPTNAPPSPIVKRNSLPTIAKGSGRVGFGER